MKKVTAAKSKMTMQVLVMMGWLTTTVVGQVGTCSRMVDGDGEFVAIGDDPDVEVLPLSSQETGVLTRSIGFPFEFFGTIFINASPSTNGNIFFASSFQQSTEAPIDGIGTPRIAVSNDWSPVFDVTERVLMLRRPESTIFSWEVNLSSFPGDNPINNGDVNFQVKLYPNGNIDVVFGSGELLLGPTSPLGPTDTLYVGIEASGAFIDVFGGPTMTWPANQAISFLYDPSTATYECVTIVSEQQQKMKFHNTTQHNTTHTGVASASRPCRHFLSDNFLSFHHDKSRHLISISPGSRAHSSAINSTQSSSNDPMHGHPGLLAVQRPVLFRDRLFPALRQSRQLHGHLRCHRRRWPSPLSPGRRRK